MNASKNVGSVERSETQQANVPQKQTLNPSGQTLRLTEGEHLRLRARGWTVRVMAGTVWMVQDGDIRDVILAAGDSIALDRDGPALLSAFGDTRLCIARDAGRCAPVRDVVPAAHPGIREPAFA